MQSRRQVRIEAQWTVVVLCGIWAVTPNVYAVDWDNTQRYLIVRGALSRAASPDSGWTTGLAGVVFDTADTPLTFFSYDTPDRRSFGAENVAKLIFGPSGGGLGANDWAGSPIGTLCTYNDGRTYGVLTDIGQYWSTSAAAPPYIACATNMHLMYNELLQAVRECGNRCFVDIASLSNINVIRSELRGAIAGWLTGKPDDARLVLRITEGFPVAHDSSIEGEVDFFQQVVRDGTGRVEVYGMPIGSGIPGGGTWSHAKLFGVYSIPCGGGGFKVLFGGQNHWTDYDNARPPFDSNTLVTGQAATLPALQMDAACKWFDDGRSWLGRSVWYKSSDRTVRNTKFKWDTAGYENASFERFSGIPNVNPRTTGTLLNPASQKALVSLIDMGAYSENHSGRTIARVLHDLVWSEPKRTHIRVLNQALCRPAGVAVDGNCGGRHEQTYVGALVYRALTAARMGWGVNVWVLTSDSQIRNVGYPSPYTHNVRRSLYDTGQRIACVGDEGQNYGPGWNALRFFNNPRGRGTCRAAVIRAINGKFRWRMTKAFINGFAPRQAVGVHHKIVMIGREAMFQGSFNAYQSVSLSDFSTYDSKLVENGGIIFDPTYVSAQADAFDEAWDNALPILDG